MKSPFLREIREHLRARQYSKRTEDTYIYWIRQYIHFHKLKHPDDLGDADIVAFLGYLAVKRQVSPATQSIALNALVYLYRQVLGRQSIDVGDFTHATPRRKLPVVLSRDEVRRLLAQLSGDHRTCAELMYGSGLRLMEVCRLRVKDIDLERLAILVRDGKGRKNRVTTLAERCVPLLERQCRQAKVYWGGRAVRSPLSDL